MPWLKLLVLKDWHQNNVSFFQKRCLALAVQHLNGKGCRRWVSVFPRNLCGLQCDQRLYLFLCWKGFQLQCNAHHKNLQHHLVVRKPKQEIIMWKFIKELFVWFIVCLYSSPLSMFRPDHRSNHTDILKVFAFEYFLL